MRKLHKILIVILSLILIYFLVVGIIGRTSTSTTYITNTTSSIIEKVATGATIDELYVQQKEHIQMNMSNRDSFLIQDYKHTLKDEQLQKVKHAKVVLYELPNEQSHVLTNVAANSLVTSWAISKEGWRYVQVNETYGYIKSEAVETLFSKQVTVHNAKGSNVYAKMDDDDVMTTIFTNQSVLAYQVNEKWLFVTTANGNGFIRSTDLLTEQQLAQRAAQKEAERIAMQKEEEARKKAAQEEAARKLAELEKQAQQEKEEKEAAEQAANQASNQQQTEKKIALTFDDGPNATITPQILALLKKHQVPATFFVIGFQVEAYPHLAQQIVTDGHQIAGHSWSHRNLSKMTLDEVHADFLKTNAVIEQITGVTPTIYRPPFGAMSDEMKADRTMLPILWTVDTLDWQHRNASQTIAEVKRAAKPDGIVLMHDIHQSTVDALEPIILFLKQKGYTFVTIANL